MSMILRGLWEKSSRSEGIRWINSTLFQLIGLAIVAGISLATYFTLTGSKELTVASWVYVVSNGIWFGLRLPKQITLRNFQFVNLILLFINAYFTGGLYSPILPLFVLIPIGTLIFGRLREVLSSVIFVTTLVGILGWISWVDMPIPQDWISEHYEDYRNISFTLAFSMSIMIIVILLIKLSAYHKRLKTSLQKQNMTWSKLASTEKFTSLGLLSAGIAHEINNPLNYIQMGSNGLSRNVAELLEYEQLRESQTHRIREALKASEDPKQSAEILEALDDIESAREQISYDEILSELNEMVDSIQKGTDRTTEIVKGLKAHTYDDKRRFGEVDLRDALDATLVLLNKHVKNRIIVAKDYGMIPKITAQPGRINQVVMNLLVNAVQAIDGEGTIQLGLKHQVSSETVLMSITDSGNGINPQDADQIFKPFYTTKKMGEGTGIGLSLVKSIVEDHKGTVTFQSNLGGTTFYVELPVHVQEEAIKSASKGQNFFASALML